MSRAVSDAQRAVVVARDHQIVGQRVQRQAARRRPPRAERRGRHRRAGRAVHVPELDEAVRRRGHQHAAPPEEREAVDLRGPAVGVGQVHAEPPRARVPEPEAPPREGRGDGVRGGGDAERAAVALVLGRRGEARPRRRRAEAVDALPDVDGPAAGRRGEQGPALVEADVGGVAAERAVEHAPRVAARQRADDVPGLGLRRVRRRRAVVRRAVGARKEAPRGVEEPAAARRRRRRLLGAELELALQPVDDVVHAVHLADEALLVRDEARHEVVVLRAQQPALLAAPRLGRGPQLELAAQRAHVGGALGPQRAEGRLGRARRVEGRGRALERSLPTVERVRERDALLLQRALRGVARAELPLEPGDALLEAPGLLHDLAPAEHVRGLGPQPRQLAPHLGHGRVLRVALRVERRVLAHDGAERALDVRVGPPEGRGDAVPRG